MALLLGLLTYMYYLYKSGRLNIALAKRHEEEPEYPDMQTYQGTVGYPSTITSPLSTYPGYTNNRHSGMRSMYHDSSISPTIQSAGTEASVGYGRPTLQRTVTDPGSTVAATRASSTIVSALVEWAFVQYTDDGTAHSSALLLQDYRLPAQSESIGWSHKTRRESLVLRLFPHLHTWKVRFLLVGDD